MNRRILVLIAAALCSCFTARNVSFAQGTSFTYQGRLNDGINPANGSYDFRFSLMTDAQGSSLFAGPLTTNAVPVAGGLFTVMLDFGANIFTGSSYWLRVDVKTNGAGSFTSLTPYQALTPAPYAMFANTASNLSGTLPSAQLSGVLPSAQLAGTYFNQVAFFNSQNSFLGSFNGNGTGLTNVNARTLGGVASSNLWQLGGNAVANGQFLGSLNNQALELKVNGLRALRLEPTINDATHSNMVNVIGGSPANFVPNGIYGATIAGGGAVLNPGTAASTNSVSGDFGTVGGGTANASGQYATVGGGIENASSGFGATVAGGANHICSGDDAAVGGGFLNTSSNYCSTVPGGANNTAGGQLSFAAGYRAKALHDGCFVWADTPSFSGADFASTSTNQFLIRAGGGVGIGTTAPEAALHVANGSAGTVTANPGSIAVFEKSGSGYVSLLGPAANELGILFGNPNTSADGGIVFNNSSVPSGLEFRTGTNNNRMVILANGNVGIGLTTPTNKLHVAGGVSAIVFVTTSDRNAKENFESVSPREVLEEVAALPITTWTFKEMPGQKHLGPMAQDFHAAFGLGGGDTGIATVDADGVALAAIQGLNQKLEAAVRVKDVRIAELEKGLAELKALVSSLAKKVNGDGR
jgi:trimeric autotransporter adhesin